MRPDNVNEVKAREKLNQEAVMSKERKEILAERGRLEKIIDKYYN